MTSRFPALRLHDGCAYWLLLCLAALLLGCPGTGSGADHGSDLARDLRRTDAIADASRDAPTPGPDSSPPSDASSLQPDASSLQPDASSPQPDASSSANGLPGGKARYSVVCGNMDSAGTTWARHANYTFNAKGTVAATVWQWDSSASKGKMPYTQHRCTWDGVTKNCTTYTPTGWVYPAKQYVNWSGTFALSPAGDSLTISWASAGKETWKIASTSSAALRRLSFVSATNGITHGVGFGSNAAWSTHQTLPQIVKAGGLKTWPGQVVSASYDGSSISAQGWHSSTLNLSSFTSASWSSAGYTLHAMLPHSASVCTGGCSGSHTGNIMYHLASEDTGRQMVYNNWCTCLSLGSEWPCYDRNMHPWAFNSFLDDQANHRGWLFIEQQNQTGYTAYQYQIGYFSDL